jgi:hypothetical protein
MPALELRQLQLESNLERVPVLELKLEALQLEHRYYL